MSTSELYAGVDVAAGRVHAALLRGDSVVSWFTGPVDGLAEFCRGAARVGVDAPGGLSMGAHLGDGSVAAKFRGGRCSEIPVPGVPAVPWVTPRDGSAAPGWMRTGFSAWAELLGAGLDVVETFPAAFFHRLNGGRWPPRKTTTAGRAARLSLLRSVVSLPEVAESWGHDEIDAVACAVVAAQGRPAPHVCSRPDGSAMWLLEDVVRARPEDGQLVEDR